MESTQDRDPIDTRRIQTRRSAEEAAALGGPYLLMNTAATLIAGFGLFEDSPAVIIGAMLIAALLGPIQGMAMALAEADLKLLRMSLTAEVTGAALVLVLGMALGTIDRTSPLGHEILSRTAPNILDLLIGLVGGAAAAYAAATPRLGALAVGVAIATALVPPLTTCGILIARGLSALAEGAFLLFLANFVAITFSAMLVFMMLGHRATIAGPAAAGRAAGVISRLVCLAVLLLLGFHLVSSADRTIWCSSTNSVSHRAPKTLSRTVPWRMRTPRASRYGHVSQRANARRLSGAPSTFDRSSTADSSPGSAIRR
jgi:uncharacterized hydrophobic protein (TIGR00271 family)